MILYDERNTIRLTIAGYLAWRQPERWGPLAPKERDLVETLEALDPETVSWQALADILRAHDRRNDPMLDDCDECGAENVPTVRFCEEADYEEPYGCFCLSCLQKAIGMLQNGTPAEIPHKQRSRYAI